MKRTIATISLTLISILSLLACQAQNNNPARPLAYFVQTRIDSLYKSEKLPGILVGIRTGGRNEIFTAGFAQPENKIVFDANTFFEAGSITKTFTAYVLQAVLRDHQLSDTASILPFLPDSVQKNKSLEPIRFLMLMNHTAGFPRLPDNMVVQDNVLQPYEFYNSGLLFAYLAKASPATEKKYDYSNLGMALAGVLAERISGKTYAALLDKYIFLPFEMVSAANSIDKNSNNSQGYFSDTEKAPYWNMNVMAPAGGIKCSATEMLRYLSCMSKPINESSAAIIQTLLQPTVTVSAAIKISRGWHLFEQKNKPIIYWHNGGTYGFSTFAAFLKDTDQAVIVVLNRFNSNKIADGLGISIMNKLLE